MPKMLLAAGPTMLVRVTATLICVAETPVTPLTAGHPGAAPPLATGAAAPVAALALGVAFVDPPFAVAAAAQAPLAPGPTPGAAGAPVVRAPLPASPADPP